MSEKGARGISITFSFEGSFAMRKLLKLVGLAVLVILIALVAAFVYIDTIARKAIEAGASYAMGVDTTLDQADVGLFTGRFAMSGLNIANPQGFTTPHFLRLGSGGVAVSLGSLRSDVVELTELQLQSIDMNLQKTAGQANYQVILNNLKRFESTEPTQKQQEQGGGKKFVIKEVLIKDVMVHVDLLPEGGKLTQVNVPIDQIRLSNVGSDSNNAVLISDLSGVLVKAIIAAAIQKAGKELPGEVLGELQSGLSQLQDLGEMGIQAVSEFGGKVQEIGGKAVEQVGKGLGGAVEEVGGQVDEALKGLGDLLGGDKKKEEEEGQ
jgi:hypothetical protein